MQDVSWIAGTWNRAICDPNLPSAQTQKCDVLLVELTRMCVVCGR